MMPHSIKAAMYTGLFSSNLMTVSAPPFSCPPGNCTWDPCGKLAVGVQCFDIASEVKLNCSDSFHDGIDGCKFVSSDGSNVPCTLINRTTDWTFMRITTDPPKLVLAAIKPFANTSAILGVVQWVKALKRFAREGDITGVYITSNTTEAHRCVFYLAVRKLEVKSRTEFTLSL
jgi:hypothetical protein